MEKTCGNCYWMMMQPGHGECGACGNPLCNEAHDPVAYSEGFYEYTTVDGDCGGEYWKEKTDTLEQRYAQLEQVARELCEMIIKHNRSDDGVICGGIDVQRQFNQLIALGVSLDD